MHLTIEDTERETRLVHPAIFPGDLEKKLEYHLSYYEGGPSLPFSAWIRPLGAGSIVELTPAFDTLDLGEEDLFLNLGTPTLSEVFAWFHSWTTQEWLECYREAVALQNLEKLRNIQTEMQLHWNAFISSEPRA